LSFPHRRESIVTHAETRRVKGEEIRLKKKRKIIMLRILQEGPITLFKMGRSIGRYVPYTVHAFMVDDILIDTGTIYAQREFMPALEGKTIRRVIHTHHHEDHIGNNGAVQRAFGAEISAHPLALPFIENPRRMPLRFYQRFVWDWPEPSRASAIGAEIMTDSYRFRVIAAPGHSPDHVCFYEPDRKWLFTGDIFCGTRLKYFRLDEDYLVTLDVDTVFCSLLGAVHDGRQALQRKAEFMEQLKDNVLERHGQGKGIGSITRALLGREGDMYYITAGHYAKRNAVKSIIGGGSCFSYVPYGGYRQADSG
jgi:glyoxylase-like metal-dependent hydrolase (beta-lactamase superfamily II)